MVWEGTEGQNMRPNRFRLIYMNTVQFVDTTIGFSENPFLVLFTSCEILSISTVFLFH